MEKKLTALQELIEYLQSFMDKNKGYKTDVTDTVQIILENAQSLLPKEREQIEGAYFDGLVDSVDEKFIGKQPNSSDYYTQTYQAQH